MVFFYGRSQGFHVYSVTLPSSSNQLGDETSFLTQLGKKHVLDRSALVIVSVVSNLRLLHLIVKLEFGGGTLS